MQIVHREHRYKDIKNYKVVLVIKCTEPCIAKAEKASSVLLAYTIL